LTTTTAIFPILMNLPESQVVAITTAAERGVVVIIVSE
jgi:hypothetical protein